MPASRPQSHFKTLQKLNLDYAPITITQYESQRTGMRAVVVDQAGPKVNGYFALATEIHDDSGAPHTLEHLCFMGSKSYKFKGLLDKLAARAYSTTNAWTAVDHTAYTLDTAGWDGFAQILPVYLEHIIAPTLTDSGCYTEVHHVDGTGHDAGVVYSEMQGVQNTQTELMDLRARRLLYPEGVGFRYETGGMMEKVRVLTADRIRDYHKEMYQPKNLRLVLTGEINHEELLRVLDDFEDTILDDVPSLHAPFQRPWIDSKQTPPISKTLVETVEFPEEDESMGEVVVGFLGPKATDNVGTSTMAVLLMYLCESSICVLEHTLVEVEQLASMITYSSDTRTDTVVWFTLSGVETERLAEVEARLHTLLQETAAKALDMDYLHDCIKRWIRQTKLRCEDAGSWFADPIIEDHLFGDRDGRDLKVLENFDELDLLAKWSDQQWRDFLSKWLVNAKHISILGKPSQALSKKLTETEEARVKEQQERLGGKGLLEKKDKLKKAQEDNDMPIPDIVLEKFPVPNVDSIHFVSTTSARAGRAKSMGRLNNDVQRKIDQDDNKSPLFIHFEDVPSNFVRIKLDLCTGSLPVELKPLILLHVANFCATPVMKDGKRIEFEDVVLALEKETVAYGVSFNHANSEMLSVMMYTEPENYESVISWLRTLMFNAIHDKERLLSQLAKILAEIPDEKRSGDDMVSAVYNMLQFERESSVRARSTLAKGPFLKRYKHLLKTSPETALSQFAQVSTTLHRPENFRIFVSADITKLPSPVSAWNALLPTDSSSAATAPLEPLDDRFALLTDLGANPGKTCIIVPMATVETSSTMLVGKSVTTYDHPDLPALLVARAYMDAVEGPFWNAVRGTGLAYTAAFSHRANLARGSILYRTGRSPDAYKALRAAKEQVEAYASGKFELNKFALEGAISEIVLDMADEQPSASAAADYSYTNQVIRGISRDYSHEMLAEVQAVTPQQIQEVVQKYFLPVFEPATSNLIVTCSLVMKDKLERDLREAGYQPEVRTLESFQDGYGMEAVEGAEEMDEDEDSEEDSEDEDDPMDTPESEPEN